MKREAISWYRVEVTPSGKAITCERVASAEASDRMVFFVRASSPEEASRLAFNKHSAMLLKRRRQRYAAEGKCRCGRARDTLGRKDCSECRKRDRLHDERHQAKKRGEVLEPLSAGQTALRRREAEAAAQRAAGRQEGAAEMRLAVLREVQVAWREAPNNGSFTAWLAAQIEAITGRRVA